MSRVGQTLEALIPQLYVKGLSVTVNVARRWRGIRITPADLEKLNGLRAEIAPLKASA